MPRLLLVDDEPDILETMPALVEASLPDVSLTTATNGLQALELLRGQRFDCMLTDYKMPGMNGLQLALEVRKTWPNVPVLMFTAFMDPGTLAEVHAQVPDLKVIPKPLDVDFLLEQVRSAFSTSSED